MGARSRSRDRGFASAGYVNLNGAAYLTGFSGSCDRETCADTTMPRPYDQDHNLEIVRRSVQPLRISGETRWNASGSVMAQFSNYNPANQSGWAYTPPVPLINWAYWVTEALANMDPYRPKVDLPLFLFELKDFPGMLKQIGRVKSGKINAGDVPGGWLAYQFGWAPLVSDLLSLFNLAKMMKDRMNYLRNLEKGSLVRRKLGEHDVTGFGNGTTYRSVALNRGGWAYQATTETRETVKVWFTARAKLLSPLPEGTSDLEDLTERMVLGLSVRPWSVWEYIPWTWLIDYFLNVGSFLEAHGALASLRIQRLNLMATQQVIRLHTGVQTADGLSARSPVMKTTVKRRKVYDNPTPMPSFVPFLSGTQMMNLGALLTAGPMKKLGR